MFGTLGGPELFLIFVVALIVFGPRKLPEIGKSLGRMMAEFRRASNDFRSTIESEVEAEKIRETMRIEPPKVTPARTSAAPPTAAGEGVVPQAADGESAPAPPAGAEKSFGDAPGAGHPGPAESAGEPVPETVSRQPEPPPGERK